MSHNVSCLVSIVVFLVFLPLYLFFFFSLSLSEQLDYLIPQEPDEAPDETQRLQLVGVRSFVQTERVFVTTLTSLTRVREEFPFLSSFAEISEVLSFENPLAQVDWEQKFHP